jgi:hypothetical protein
VVAPVLAVGAYSREILATQLVFVWALVMILVMMAVEEVQRQQGGGT